MKCRAENDLQNRFTKYGEIKLTTGETICKIVLLNAGEMKPDL